MGHQQPYNQVYVDTTTCVGIVNSTIRRQQSHTMEMRYLWLLYQTTHQYIKVYYKPGAEHISDFQGKAHTGQINKHVRP